MDPMYAFGAKCTLSYECDSLAFGVFTIHINHDVYLLLCILLFTGEYFNEAVILQEAIHEAYQVLYMPPLHTAYVYLH